MRRAALVITLLASALCASCAAPPEREPLPSDYDSDPGVYFQRPVLRFDIIEIPHRGEITAVSGDVERLNPMKFWVAVVTGDHVSHKDQLRIGSGAILTLAFSGTEHAEFAASANERWVQFEVAGE